ncbi:MAG: methyltransferase domain-containing protein [Gammaproteobacteria bacterium]|nr:methyltransferase domain-containing protein [Gammaproteobacteria bacterium]
MAVIEPKQRQRIVNRHRNAYNSHGFHANALNWSSKEYQYLLFDVLLDIGVELGSKVLDFGCGFGDLCGYIAAKGIEVDYTGIDLSPELLNEARYRHKNSTFFEGDLFELDPPSQSFDYVFASGSLSEPLEDGGDYTRHTITRLFESSRKGLAFNLLDSAHEWTANRFDLQSFDAEEMVEWCHTLTPDVGLRRDYAENSFTLYLRRL